MSVSRDPAGSYRAPSFAGDRVDGESGFQAEWVCGTTYSEYTGIERR